MQSKIFAGFATATDKKVTIDLDAFLRRILLFDEYIVQTVRLDDIAQLAKNFGVDGLIRLLEAGVIRIHCDALTMAQTGQSVIYEREGKGILPLGSYSFHNINISDRTWYLSDCLKNVHAHVPNLKKAIRLKKAILQVIVPTSFDKKTYIYQGFDEALQQNRRVIKTALAQTLPAFGQRGVDPERLQIKIEQINERDYKADSNLSELLNLSPEDSHKIIERSLLSVSGLYQRLGYMKDYSAIAWFHEDDLALLNTELSLFSFEADSNHQENRLTRLLDLKGLPQIDNEHEIDAGRLLKLRESPECKEFREWLKAGDLLSDEDIKKAINSFRAKVISALGGRIGKTIRFIVSTGIGVGMGAVAGPAAGVAIDAVDEFVLESIIKKPGPISFINNSLPKLYKN